MSETSSTSTWTLEEFFRAAYPCKEAGCPPPEAWLEAETGARTPEARRDLEAHAGRCPVCAAEWDLARLFDAGPEAAGVSPEDVGFVVSRLSEVSPVRTGRNPAAPRVVLFPGQRFRQLPASFVRLAAAAVLALVAGLGWTLYAPAPSLPELRQGGAVRAIAVEALAPVGEVDAMPAELRWARMGAASYRVRLTAVDGTLLWESRVTAPSVRLPAEVAARLHRAVVYVWSVEALDVDGKLLAGSEPIRFLAKP